MLWNSLTQVTTNGPRIKTFLPSIMHLTGRVLILHIGAQDCEL